MPRQRGILNNTHTTGVIKMIDTMVTFFSSELVTNLLLLSLSGVLFQIRDLLRSR